MSCFVVCDPIKAIADTMVEVKFDEIDAEEWQRWQQEEEASQPKRQRTSQGSGGAGGGRASGGGHSGSRSSSAAIGARTLGSGDGGGELALVAPQQDGGTVSIPRTTLATIVDHVDRATRAAYHAVTISQQARNAFEEEHRLLTQLGQELRDLVNRGRIV